MQKTLIHGLMLLMMYSCSSAVIKEPQPVYVINSKFMAVAEGLKDFNYKNGHESMGEWIAKPKLIKWSEMPENIIGFPLEIWLTKLKPVLKQAARKHRDAND